MLEETGTKCKGSGSGYPLEIELEYQLQQAGPRYPLPLMRAIVLDFDGVPSWNIFMDIPKHVQPS
jgi:hypothetical protein